jgi:hypothetical protein
MGNANVGIASPNGRCSAGAPHCANAPASAYLGSAGEDALTREAQISFYTVYMKKHRQNTSPNQLRGWVKQSILSAETENMPTPGEQAAETNWPICGTFRSGMTLSNHHCIDMILY